ncbi:hypothetical protein VNO77_21058 [Canavalia gladiata]|uniref:Uncharacterized protein n=1 Tax=Canavalia gladiata TaxID=3824 RepID=A0AAN9QN17_CANGL
MTCGSIASVFSQNRELASLWHLQGGRMKKIKAFLWKNKRDARELHGEKSQRFMFLMWKEIPSFTPAQWKIIKVSYRVTLDRELFSRSSNGQCSGLRDLDIVTERKGERALSGSCPVSCKNSQRENQI